MPGTWYPTAVVTAAAATAVSALFSLSGNLLGNAQAPRIASERQKTDLPKRAAATFTASPSATNSQFSSISSQASFDRAMELANQAVEAYQSAQSTTGEARIDFILREHFLWQGSLEKLAAIPPGDRLHPQAIEKAAHYQQLLAAAEQKIAASDRSLPSCNHVGLIDESDPLRAHRCR